MRWILHIAFALLAAAASSPAASAATKAFPSAVASYRLPPAANAPSPLEQEKLHMFRSQLQERVFDFERDRPGLDVLEDEELRRARGELERMNRIIKGIQQ